jgi:sterol desaturase/sphingolipid hydroxylase (fatty acid hydroxylase superfamily)
MDPASLTTPAGTIALILTAMAVIALVESALPFRALGRARRTHLVPNLVLTGITFATNAAFGAGLVALLAWQEARGVGLLHFLALPAWAEAGVVLVVLDFAFYVAHVAMHKLPGFWRFHRVHHSDPAVDVTTTIRQHPGESVIRYAFASAFACALGASPAAFALYRAAVALVGLLEHANLACPAWLERTLALVTSWPHVHKIHHARDAALTDTNYGNLFIVWDRAFGTFTPSRHAAGVAYGLADCDAPETQTTAGLLVLPFRTTDAARPNLATAE